MTARPASRVPPAHRVRVLRALGITPWVRRVPGIPASTAVAGEGVPAVPCVVLLPADCPARELDLLGRALAACGSGLARAGRILVRDGQLLAEVPSARAYLAFGEAQAHALGRQLPAAAMRQAQVVLADEPAQVLADGAGKRRLWAALRQLRRALAATAPEDV
jgi:hypothetical protein